MRITFAGRQARAGFTLLEMSVVMSVLAAIMGLGMAILFLANKTGIKGDQIAQHLARRMELARHFRDDVSRATGTVEQFENYRSGPACLLLTMAGGSTVIYQGKGDSVDRIERTGAKTTTLSLKLDRRDNAIEFVRPSSSRGMVTMRIIESKETSLSRTSDISAALGGDLR